MTESEGNCFYDKNRQIKQDPITPIRNISQVHGSPDRLNSLTLTVWGEQCDRYKLLWEFSQVMKGQEIQHGIYDDETIILITWLIIGNGRQYFSQYLMSSALT